MIESRIVELDGAGGARPLEGGREPTGVVWRHLDLSDSAQRAWLDASGIDPLIVRVLVAEDSRPRSLVSGDGLLITLRGINVSQDGEPEDMVSLRMWFEANRVVTCRWRRVAAGAEVLKALEANNGPKDAGELLIDLTDRLIHRIGEHVDELEERVDALEELVLNAPTREARTRISDLRREGIALRRYLAPQRDTIGRLHMERVNWLDDRHRATLRETGDRVTRYVETLDASRERAAVTAEELSNRVAEQMNQTMYVLSVITSIFLPLGLLTGLLGINVGGMPGADSPIAFWLVCLALVGLGIAQWLWFRRMQLV